MVVIGGVAGVLVGWGWEFVCLSVCLSVFLCVRLCDNDNRPPGGFRRK